LVLSDVETIHSGVTFLNFIIEDDNLLMHLQTRYKDYLLHIYDKDKVSTAHDVVKINNIITVGRGHL